MFQEIKRAVWWLVISEHCHYTKRPQKVQKDKRKKGKRVVTGTGVPQR